MKFVISFLMATVALLVMVGVYYFATWLFNENGRAIVAFTVVFVVAWFMIHDILEVE